ncbi:formate dehydrogenase accessory protein FdhE [Chloroflexota bacterium]
MPREKNKNRDSDILQRLGEWRQKDGSLPQPIELYSRLLHLQTSLRSSLTVPEPSLSEEAVLSQLRQGLPLLNFDDLMLDWKLVQNQFRMVIDILADYIAEEMGDTERLKDLASDILELKQAVRDWYQGLTLSSIVKKQHISEAFLSAAIQATLRPFLTAHSEALYGLVQQDLWRRIKCPVCGGKPDLAFLEKERGARWLLCSRCDTEWLFQRLECPYCGTQNQDDLSYLTDDKELYRLYTCEKCHSYIKAIDLRKTDAEVLLPLEKVITADMDRQAKEAGYRAR